MFVKDFAFSAIVSQAWKNVRKSFSLIKTFLSSRKTIWSIYQFTVVVWLRLLDARKVHLWFGMSWKEQNPIKPALLLNGWILWMPMVPCLTIRLIYFSLKHCGFNPTLIDLLTSSCNGLCSTSFSTREWSGYHKQLSGIFFGYSIHHSIFGMSFWSLSWQALILHYPANCLHL